MLIFLISNHGSLILFMLMRRFMLCLMQLIWLSYGGMEIKWEYLVKLHNLQDREGLLYGIRVRKAHIAFQHNKQKVKLATHTADALETLREKGYSDFNGSEATEDFIRHADSIFDIFNSKNLNAEKIKTCHLHGLKVPSFDDKQGAWYGPIPTVESSWQTGFVGFISGIDTALSMNDIYVKTGILDFLPTSKGGWNNNPNVMQFMSAYKRLLIQVQLGCRGTPTEWPFVYECLQEATYPGAAGWQEERQLLAAGVYINEFAVNLPSAQNFTLLHPDRSSQRIPRRALPFRTHKRDCQPSPGTSTVLLRIVLVGLRTNINKDPFTVEIINTEERVVEKKITQISCTYAATIQQQQQELRERIAALERRCFSAEPMECVLCGEEVLQIRGPPQQATPPLPPRVVVTTITHHDGTTTRDYEEAPRQRRRPNKRRARQLKKIRRDLARRDLSDPERLPVHGPLPPSTSSRARYFIGTCGCNVVMCWGCALHLRRGVETEDPRYKDRRTKCPVCRIQVDWGVPNIAFVWREDRKALLDLHRQLRAITPCRKAQLGGGSPCPFGNRCHYSHRVRLMSMTAMVQQHTPTAHQRLHEQVSVTRRLHVVGKGPMRTHMVAHDATDVTYVPAEGIPYGAFPEHAPPTPAPIRRQPPQALPRPPTPEGEEEMDTFQYGPSLIESRVVHCQPPPGYNPEDLPPQLQRAEQ
ncbi:putative E3 ubiquitin-protein ligase makorin-2, partial [Frankliniella fusca]